MPPFPEWWAWDLSFTAHAEMRMQQRGVTEVSCGLCWSATGFRPNAVEGRFTIDVRHQARPWKVIVEPDAEAWLLVVVTVYLATSDGLLVVDYSSDGRPVGVEMTAPQAVSLERINELLASLGQPPLGDHEFKPVRAA